MTSGWKYVAHTVMLIRSGKAKVSLAYIIRNQVGCVLNCNSNVRSNLSHFVIRLVEFLILLEQLKEKYLLTLMVKFVKKKKKEHKMSNIYFLHRIVNFSDTLSTIILSLPS